LTGIAWVESADRGKGTGFVVDRPRRLLVSCLHVVGDNDHVEAIFPWHDRNLVTSRARYQERMPELRKRGFVVRGKVIRRDLRTDLALIELASLPEETTALVLAQTEARIGDGVHLVGNRYDVDTLWTYAGGHVRAVRTLRDGYFTAGRQLAKGARTILASAPINEGDSGAPLVNEQGEVVGVAAAVAWEHEGAGIFVDLAELRALVGASRPARPAASQVYRRAVRATALVQYEGGPRRAGVLLDRGRRLILTTARAVAREETVEVVFPVEQSRGLVVETDWYRKEKRSRLRGVPLAVDPRRNLALVEVESVPGGADALSVARRVPQPGDVLHLISHPRRLEVLWAYAVGSLRQTGTINLGLQADGPDPNVLIVQAPLGEGEEGGPVLDEEGNLVGLASGRIGPQQQIAFALSADEITAFLTEQGSQVTPRTPADHVQRGERFTRAREYDRAIKAYDEALTLAPRQVAALTGRAWVRTLQGQHDLALTDCDRALSIDRRSALALCHRGAAWCGKGQPNRAIADADQALKIEPKVALAFAIRAQARLLLSESARAIADADEAIWLDSKLGLAYRLRGMGHARLDAFDKAVADLTRAIALDPRDALAYVERSDLHRRKNDPEAITDLTQALKFAGSVGTARLAEEVKAVARIGDEAERARRLEELAGRLRRLLGARP
jgi:S1-C subfamily serine protease